MSSSRWFLLLAVCALLVPCVVLLGCGSSSSASTPPPSQSSPTFQLSVKSPPPGQGEIVSSPSGINCPGTCQASFAQNTKVTLTANPGSDYFFEGWSGACSGTSCTVTMTAAETVSASFLAGEGVSIALSGVGVGTVISNPSGIDCTTGASKGCSAVFPENTKVTLTETPGTNYYFGGWNGCSGTTYCEITVSGAQNIVATFNGPDTLLVAVVGNGSGNVTSNPVGIDCPTQCSAKFAPNTQVTLTETPGTNYYFGGWTGCSGGNTCTVTVNAPQNVTATFTTGDALTVTMQGAGIGNVTSSPSGINCTSGSTSGCTASFPPNSVVTLSETVNPPNQFSGWSGVCTGNGTTCNLTLTSPNNAEQATFSPGGTLQSLNHIIFYAQENRSLDSYFGYLPQYWVNIGLANPPAFNGLPQFIPPANPANTPTNPPCSSPTGQCQADPGGTLVPSFHFQSICTEELSPFWNEAHVDWNYAFDFPNTVDWEDNGFVQAAANDARDYTDGPVNDTNGYRSMGYFTDQDLNFYYALATDFATSDSWFAPVMTRTQMNRAYIYAATSQGRVYPLHKGEHQLSVQPFVEALQAAGITWAIYVETEGTACEGETGDQLSECLLEGYSYLNQFDYENTIIASAGQNPDLLKNIRPTSQFATDIQNEQTFPQVVLIEPASDYGRDEHPTDVDAEGGVNIQAGAAYVENIVNEFMGSPAWKDSAMIFTYDEWGGFFDHVQPQPVPVPDEYHNPRDLQPGDECEGADQQSGVCSFGITGYRIPVVVISPFSKKNYVSHVVRDTTVWLNLVEERFGIPALTNRDAYWSTSQSGSNGQPNAQMDEFFDFVNVPWQTPPTLPAQNQNGTCSLAAPNPWGD